MMSQKISSRTWTIFGIGIAIVAGLALLLAFLGRKPGEPGSMITPAVSTPLSENTAAPVASTAQSPIPTPFTSPLPTPTTATMAQSPLPLPATEMPYPTPVLALPAIAPDFTLERAGGSPLTLSEQLAQGPVVLAFFQRSG
jgi:hypothetical protein